MSDYTFVLPNGTQRDLESDYGLRVLYGTGMGMPPLKDIMLDYAQGDGALHQTTLAGMRVIHLVGKINTPDILVGPAMHALRKKIIDDINRDAMNDGSFLFRYSGANSSVPLDIRCMLFDGLGGSNMTGGVEDVTLELHCHDPFWRAVTQTTTSLATTNTFTNAKWLTQKVAGVWAGINPTPGSNGCPDESPIDMVSDVNGVLYVATSAGVYKYSASAWTKYAANGVVNALCVGANGTDIYAGGAFTTINGVSANRVAKLVGSTWSALSTGISSGAVFALLYNGSTLYAGGSFNDGLAGWNGSTWSRIGSPAIYIPSGTVYSLAADGAGNIYAGGSFTTVVGQGTSQGSGGSAGNGSGGHAAPGWSGPDGSGCYTLTTLSVENAGTNYYYPPSITYNFASHHSGSCTLDATITANLDGSGHISSFAIVDGGKYDNYGYSSPVLVITAALVTTASKIIKISSSGIVSSMAGGANGTVYALAVAASGTVFAGGAFTDIGSRIASWNGTSWSALAAGLNNTVNSLAIDAGGVLYAVGLFTNGGYPYLAKWTAGAWSGDTIIMAVGGSTLDIYGTVITVGTISPGTMPSSNIIGYTTLNNTGNHVASPVIKLTATGAVTIYTFTNNASGKALDFGAYVMGAGEAITIDLSASPATVISSSNGNILGAVKSSLDQFGVSPGSNIYTLSSSDGTLLSGTVRYYSSFWSYDG